MNPHDTATDIAATQSTSPAELLSGHDAEFVTPEELDAHAFREAEKIGQPWSWERQRGAG